MTQMLTQTNSMVNVIKGFFPTLEYAIDTILSSSIITSLIQFLKLIGFTAIAYIVYILLARKLYFKGLIGNLYSGSKRSNKKVNLNSKKTTIGKSYVSKEFKILFRNPVYLVQCILPAVLFPILMVALVFIGLNGEELQEIRSAATIGESDKPMMYFIILAGIQFFSMIIYVSATAISREGANAVYMKYIPVSLYKQYVYKTIPNIIMNLVMIVLTLGIAKYIIDISIFDLVMLFIISTIIAVFQSFLLILVDLKRPKLKWSSEYAVVKQNMNLIFPMIFAFINIGLVLAIISLMEKWPIYLTITVIGVLLQH